MKILKLTYSIVDMKVKKFIILPVSVIARGVV